MLDRYQNKMITSREYIREVLSSGDDRETVKEARRRLHVAVTRCKDVKVLEEAERVLKPPTTK